MSASEAEFYDAAVSDPQASSRLPLSESPWRPLYVEAANWIPLNHPVVDLGCGTGRFTHALFEPSSPLLWRTGPYVGIDFSQASLEEANTYVGALDLGPDDADIEFRLGDLREWTTPRSLAGNTHFACLETLEHLDDDLALVRKIPPGFDLVFSVPNYDSEAHMRTFASVGDVFGRYGPLLTFRRWSLIELGQRHAIHLLEARRRLESW